MCFEIVELVIMIPRAMDSSTSATFSCICKFPLPLLGPAHLSNHAIDFTNFQPLNSRECLSTQPTMNVEIGCFVAHGLSERTG